MNTEKAASNMIYRSGRDSCRLEDRRCKAVGECLLYAQAEKVDSTAEQKEKEVWMLIIGANLDQEESAFLLTGRRNTANI